MLVGSSLNWPISVEIPTSAFSLSSILIDKAKPNSRWRLFALDGPAKSQEKSGTRAGRDLRGKAPLEGSQEWCAPTWCDDCMLNYSR